MDHRLFLIDFLIILVLQLYVIDSLIYSSQVSHVRHRLYIHGTGLTYMSQVSYTRHRFLIHITGFTCTSQVLHVRHMFHIHVTDSTYTSHVSHTLQPRACILPQTSPATGKLVDLINIFIRIILRLLILLQN